MGDSLTVTIFSETNEEGNKIKHASITWEIGDFVKNVSHSKKYCSHEFQCSDATWSLHIYIVRANARIELRKVDSVALKHAVFVKCFFLQNGQQLETCKHKYIFEKHLMGHSCKIHEVAYERCLDCYGNLTVKCDMIVSGANNTSAAFHTETKKDHKEKSKPKKDANTNISSGDSSCDDRTAEKEGTAALVADIEALQTKPRFPDVTLKINDLEFPAHKGILSSRSKVFEAMFEHDMKESRQDTVELIDMEAATVKDMLRYIYCGKLGVMSPEEALKLYVAADRYDLPGLVLKCRKIVLSGLSIDSICEISVVADLHNDPLLLRAVRALLCDKMKEVFKTDKWIIFAKETPILSLNLIQSAVLNN